MQTASLTSLQAECVPLILGGGDIMAAAETGSGKTGAFALPVLQVRGVLHRCPVLGSLCAALAGLGWFCPDAADAADTKLWLTGPLLRRPQPVLRLCTKPSARGSAAGRTRQRAAAIVAPQPRRPPVS